MAQRDEGPGLHHHSITDLPIGRGPNKVVTTNILRDPVNLLNDPSGAKITGYDNALTGILAPDGSPADNVQDAIDGLFGLDGLPIVSAQFNGAAPLPPNTGVRRFIVVTTTGGTASIGELLYDNGLGTGSMRVLPVVDGRVISVTTNLTGGTIEFIGDTLYEWDTPTGVWNPVGDFLAPNEFYVDTTLGAANVGRRCPTVESAVALAGAILAPGAAIIIRLREGQQHTANVSFSPTRDVSIYTEAPANGPGIDTTLLGKLTLTGPALSFGAPAASLPLVAVQRVLTIQNTILRGGLYQRGGWKVLCKGVTFVGFAHTIDENAGVGEVPELVYVDCGDGGAFFVVDHTIKIETVNTAGALPGANLFLDRCELTLENIAPKGGTPPILLDHANASFTGCVLNSLIDADNSPIIDTLGPAVNLVFSQTTVNLTVTGGGTGKITSSPFSITLNTFQVNPTLFGGSTWRLHTTAAPVLGGINGAVQVGRFAEPPRPPQGVGMVVPDETLKGPRSGREGSVTPRILDGEGYSMAGGSFLYATLQTTDAALTRMSILLPIFSSPTVDYVPINPDRVVRFEIIIEARETTGGLRYGVWTFSGVLVNAAGATIMPAGPNKVIVTATAGVNADVNLLTGLGEEGIELLVDGSGGVDVDWRARILWLGV